LAAILEHTQRHLRRRRRLGNGLGGATARPLEDPLVDSPVHTWLSRGVKKSCVGCAKRSEGLVFAAISRHPQRCHVEIDFQLMASCPRCGAAAAGAVCAACGESLAFAPPSALADGAPAFSATAPGEGAGWLIATGVIQILLGAFWVIMGIFFAAAAQSTEFLTALHIDKMPPAATGVVLVVMSGGGLATIVISSFVIARRKWAWIVSLVFDGLWALLGVISLIIQPLSG